MRILSGIRRRGPARERALYSPRTNAPAFLWPGQRPLSFAYALLLVDGAAALSAASLDPNVGYLHVDRPAALPSPWISWKNSAP